MNITSTPARPARGGRLLAGALLVAGLAAATPARATPDCAGCPHMVSLPGGRFLMGAPEDEPGRDGNEGPQVMVRVAPFAVARTEVTRGQFRRFVEDSGHRVAPGCWTLEDDRIAVRPARHWDDTGLPQDDDHPVVCVAHADAEAYAAWLSARTGERYRLPSEAEWEYAARAGNASAAPWSDVEAGSCTGANLAHGEVLGREAWPCEDPWRATAPVGRFPANAFGLHDLLGNASEWVADCWNPSHAGAPADGSVRRDGRCDWRVHRGGGWFSLPATARHALRQGDDRATGSMDLGFRVVRERP